MMVTVKPGYRLSARLKARLSREPLPDSILGRLYFRFREAPIVRRFAQPGDCALQVHRCDLMVAGTNPDLNALLLLLAARAELSICLYEPSRSGVWPDSLRNLTALRAMLERSSGIHGSAGPSLENLQADIWSIGYRRKAAEAVRETRNFKANAITRLPDQVRWTLSAEEQDDEAIVFMEPVFWGEHDDRAAQSWAFLPEVAFEPYAPYACCIVMARRAVMTSPSVGSFEWTASLERTLVALGSARAEATSGEQALKNILDDILRAKELVARLAESTLS